MMKKYIILAAIGALIATSCTQSEIQQQFDPQQGEPIEVPLELSFERSAAISRSATEPQTTNEGALAGELSVGEIDQAQSKAVDESKVANVWVLQFDGTEADSKLIYKSYIENYAAGSTVPVLPVKTACRVAIVANTFDAAFGDGFALSTTTWTNVSAATKGVASQDDVLCGGEYLPMSGSTTGTVAVGEIIEVALVRTVAKLTIKIRSGVDLAATELNVQLCSVPTTTGWFPDTGTGVWPASVTTIDYAAENITGVSTSEYKELTYWVPVNRRGNVEGAVGITRVPNAPAGATYLKVLFGSITYTIHLGGDFLTDYNLKGNTAYSYSLTLQTDPEGTDSRVSDQRTLGDLVQDPSGELAAVGATVTVKSPSAMAGLIWSGSTDPAVGFDVGAFSGSGPTGSVPVTVSLNPTNAVRSSVFTATGVNGKTASLTIRQAASSLIYASTSATTPVGADATSVTFTVTGTAGLVLSFAKTSGATDFSTPADLTCDGTAQTVTVSMAANKGAAREAVYSATVTNPGASGLNLSGITVKQAVATYVTIGSLKWAVGNLVADGAGGCKIGAPTDYGLYFQFGSLVGWTGGASGNGVGTGSSVALGVQVKPATYGGSEEWTTVGYYKDGTAGTGNGLPAMDDAVTGIGDPCRYYLGAPWRTPTAAEYATLDELGCGGWVTSPAAGRWFGVNPGTVSSSVFFPASGYRDDPDGEFAYVGNNGVVWSSAVAGAAWGYVLRHNSVNALPTKYEKRSWGLGVRCVASA